MSVARVVKVSGFSGFSGVTSILEASRVSKVNRVSRVSRVSSVYAKLRSSKYPLCAVLAGQPMLRLTSLAPRDWQASAAGIRCSGLSPPSWTTWRIELEDGRQVLCYHECASGLDALRR
jgi:hypothetical protein